MKDIDRNINAIIYNNIIRTDESVILLNEENNPNFDSSKYTLISTIGANITGDSGDKVLFNKNIDSGVYYYQHILYPVTENNTQCLFMLGSGTTYSPFYSYYAQSPISDSTGQIVIGKKFIYNSDKKFQIARNKPVDSNFTMKSTISLWRANL